MKTKNFRSVYTITLDTKEKNISLAVSQTDLDTNERKSAINIFNLEVVPLDMAMQTIVNILMPRK